MDDAIEVIRGLEVIQVHTCFGEMAMFSTPQMLPRIVIVVERNRTSGRSTKRYGAASQESLQYSGGGRRIDQMLR